MESGALIRLAQLASRSGELMPLVNSNRVMPMPNAIVPFGPACEPFQGTGVGAVSATIAAGQISPLSVYAMPFIVWEPWTVRAVSVSNGTIIAGSWDIGIFSWDGTTKLVSTGAVTQAGASLPQVSTVTATTLPVGRYWMALGASSSSANYARWSLSGNWYRASGLMIHTVASSASPLPSSLTLAAPSATAVIPFFTLLDRYDS